MRLNHLAADHMPDLSFDDVLLEPQHTEISPEEVSLRSEAIRGLTLDLPLFSAHMATVSSVDLSVSMAEIGAVGVMHREMPLAQTAKEVASLADRVVDVARYPKATCKRDGRPVSIFACSPYETERAELLLGDPSVDYVVFDNVQPLHAEVIRSTERFSMRHPGRIILGNIATRQGAEIYGAMPLAAIKVGLGPGSICTTRVVSGCGVPQLTAIAEVSAVLAPRRMPLIADGGIRSSGDIVKALAAGADGVMLGKLLAGCDEAPGELVHHENGHQYKKYEGARYTSVELPEKTGFDKIDAFLAYRKKTEDLRVEGTSGLVPYRGPAQLIMYNLMRGVKLGFAFVGASSVEELRKRAVFRYVSNGAQIESRDSLPITTSISFL